MFDSKEFFEAVQRANLSIPKLAEILGINKVTLYRKISGESDFGRAEIQKCRDIFGKEAADKIFFADVVA